MRKLLLALIGLLIAAGLVAVIFLWNIEWNNYSDPSQRLAAVGDVAAFGTLYFAVVAAVVALVAYQIASQRPDLDVELKFPFSEVNAPVLPHLPAKSESVQFVDLDTSIDLGATIRLTNKTKYSARNPYVRLELINLTDLVAAGEWKTVIKGAGGTPEIAWDGLDRSVHDWRELPTIDFAGVRALKNVPEYRIDLHVAAEGFAHTFPIGVKILPREEWDDLVED